MYKLTSESSEITSAVKRAEETVKEARRIGDALNRARNELGTKQGESQGARDELATSEADASLSGGTADPKARKRFAGLRDEIDIATAKVEGLQARNALANDAVIQARRGVAEVWSVFAQTETDRFMTEYLSPAVSAFCDVLAATEAVAVAFGQNQLGRFVRNVQLPSPGDSRIDLANPRRINWRNNPEASRLTDAFSRVQKTVAPYLGEPVKSEV